MHLITDPKENEEINEELSNEELKSVSGGLRVQIRSSFMDKGGAFSDACLPSCAAQGSGSGLTKADWDRKIRRGGDSAISVPIGEGENCW